MCFVLLSPSLQILRELAAQLIAQWCTLGTWIVNLPSNITFVVLLSQICLQVVWSRGVFAFLFILKYKLAAFGLLQESEGNTSAGEVNHKRGVEGINAFFFFLLATHTEFLLTSL